MHTWGKKSEHGFNLLEVVIAAMIFSVTTLSFMGVWGMQVRAVEKSRHVMVATFIAEGLIAEARAQGYERTNPGITLFAFDPNDPNNPDAQFVQVETSLRGPDGTWTSKLVNYRASREVIDVFPTDPNDKVRSVIVKVNWDDSSKVGEIVLETFVAGVF